MAHKFTVWFTLTALINFIFSRNKKLLSAKKALIKPLYATNIAPNRHRLRLTGEHGGEFSS